MSDAELRWAAMSPLAQQRFQALVEEQNEVLKLAAVTPPAIRGIVDREVDRREQMFMQYRLETPANHPTTCRTDALRSVITDVAHGRLA